MDSGSLSEIVRSVGRSFEKDRRRAVDQSRKSVESCFAQKRRSSSSDSNLGSCLSFFLLIRPQFPSCHIPRRNHSDQGASCREADEQPAPRVSLAKRKVSDLGR